MSERDLRVTEPRRSPREGVLFKFGSDFETRHLREQVNEVTEAFETQPVTYYGDYAGWVTQPGSNQRDGVPTQDAPDATDSVWQDIEIALDDRLNILDTYVLQEQVEEHVIDLSRTDIIEEDSILYRAPVPYLERLEVGEVGKPSTPEPNLQTSGI